MLTNPISFRIWYPRIVEDADFFELLSQLQRIRADRVFFMDAGYMDNFQLSDSILEQRVPVLRKRIQQCADDGILAGINSLATIGHGGIRGFSDQWFERRDIEWWVDADGSPATGVACPLGRRFLKFVDEYFAQLASTGAREIFIDDDMRPTNHLPAMSELGCFCDRHVNTFCRVHRIHPAERASLVEKLMMPWETGPSGVQIAWHAFTGQAFLEMARVIRAAVDSVDPGVRLGLMPVQNFIIPYGTDYFNEMIAIVSGSHRPLLRTHNFHGSPYRVHPGSAIHARLSVPPDTEHLVEIEDFGHNFHDFVRSPRQARYAVLTALATGMGGASVNILGDQPPMMDWEKSYFSSFEASDGFYRAISRLTGPGAVMRGVPVFNPSLVRKVPALDHSKDRPSAILWSHRFAPEMMLSPLGIAYEFSDNQPALLTGRAPRLIGRMNLEKVLDQGALIDVDAARHIIAMGLGDRLGVRVGDPIASYTGQKFVDRELCGPYAGRIVPLRRIYRIHAIEYDPAIYQPASMIVHATPERGISPGVLVRRDGPSRLCVTAYPLLACLESEVDESGIIVCRHHRHLLVKLFEWVMGRSLPVWIDGPPHLAPYYFENPENGGIVLSVFNPSPDGHCDFDIVLGELDDCVRIRRVMEDGTLAPVRNMTFANGRLRIDREHALPPCDVTVFTFDRQP